MLKWVDPVRIGTDAPGPQSGFELTPLKQATLHVAGEQFAGVCLGRAHLDAELSPLDNQLVAHGAAHRATERRHEMKT